MPALRSRRVGRRQRRQSSSSSSSSSSSRDGVVKRDGNRVAERRDDSRQSPSTRQQPIRGRVPWDRSADAKRPRRRRAPRQDLKATPMTFRRRPNARAHAHARARRMSEPTLSQTWTAYKPRSAMCVQSVDVHVSCSSHSDAQLAAFFIDPRAK